GVDSQLDLYRSLLAGRRMLIVLDNARDTAQVRPLLPGAPGCLAAVTSRNQLTGLIATNDAHPVPLEVLTLAESRELLTRRLGAHPGPDSSAAAAASLAGLPPDRAHAALAELTGANLLSQPAAGRYSLHDLLRAYARDLATRFDTDEERRAASHRVLDHYLHSAHTAAVLISPGRTPIALSPPRSGVTPEKPGDHEEAL